jgi:phage baseplate assembly protein W
MSISLRLQHGDLALEGNSLASVSGGQKLLQDLRCTILTPQGSVEPHSEYGSILNDEISTNIIGAPNNSRAAVAIQAEVNRVCGNYQKQQIARNQADASTYGRLTVTPDETLLKIKEIEATPIEDKMIVAVTIETGNEEIKIVVPIEV